MHLPQTQSAASRQGRNISPLQLLQTCHRQVFLRSVAPYCVPVRHTNLGRIKQKPSSILHRPSFKEESSRAKRPLYLFSRAGPSRPSREGKGIDLVGLQSGPSGQTLGEGEHREAHSTIHPPNPQPTMPTSHNGPCKDQSPLPSSPTNPIHAGSPQAPFQISNQVQAILKYRNIQIQEEELRNILTNPENYPPLPPPANPPTPATVDRMDTTSALDDEAFPRKRPADQEWQTVHSGKNRRPARLSPNQTTSTHTPTSNTFAPLQSLSDKQPPPPPIVLSRDDYEPSQISLKLKEKLPTSKFLIKPTARQIRIHASDPESHQNILSLLQKPTSRVEFYTYAPRGTKRNKKFVIYNLDLDHPLEQIKEALQHEDLIDVRRMSRRSADGRKFDLEPVVVTFSPTYDPKKHLDQIHHINHVKITYKKLLDSEDVPQCFRCQRFGHTKRYCHLKPRCVRCSEEHHVSECPRADKPVKCANCGENHPASFRQCSHRLLLLERIQARKTSSLTPEYIPAPPPTHNPWTRQSANPEPSHHQTTAPPQPSPQPNPPSAPAWVGELSNTLNRLTNMMETLMNLMGKLINSK